VHVSPSVLLTPFKWALDWLCARPKLEILIEHGSIYQHRLSPEQRDLYRIVLSAQVRILNLSQTPNRIQRLTLRRDEVELPCQVTDLATDRLGPGQPAVWRALGRLEDQRVQVQATAFAAEPDVHVAHASMNSIEITIQPIHGRSHRLTFARSAFPLTAIP
jgi:hypothetical protein